MCYFLAVVVTDWGSSCKCLFALIIIFPRDTTNSRVSCCQAAHCWSDKKSGLLEFGKLSHEDSAWENVIWNQWVLAFIMVALKVKTRLHKTQPHERKYFNRSENKTTLCKTQLHYKKHFNENNIFQKTLSHWKENRRGGITLSFVTGQSSSHWRQSFLVYILCYSHQWLCTNFTDW